MPTKLLKPIKRELVAATRTGRTLIAELEPGDEITFREKGKRTRYTCSLHACYRVAIMQHLRDEYVAKLELYKAGRRTRKPKPPTFGAFARELQLALNK